MGGVSWQWKTGSERERTVKSVQGNKIIGKCFIIVFISYGSKEQSQSSNSEIFADVRNELNN